MSENSQPQVQVSEPVTEQVTPVVASKKGLSKKVTVGQKKMIDGMKFYEKSKLKDGDFVKVKGNQLKFYEYTLAGEVNLDCDTEKAFRFDNWSITLELTISLVDYTKVVEKAVDNHYKVDEHTTKSDIDDSKKVYIKSYKEFHKETVHYKVNDDKINVLTYDKKGKLSEEKSLNV